MTDNNRSKGSQIAIIIGAALVLFGIYQLMRVTMGSAWYIFERVFGIISGIAWPLLIIGAGAFVVYTASKGGFANVGTSGKKLYRSQTDKWVSGVIGGIAEYLGIDSTVLRVIYIVFIIASFWTAGLVYFVAAVIMPENPYISTEPK